IIPRPIALVSSISKSGVENLAPFSFFMAGGANPPSVVFSPVVGPNGSEKDTLVNIRETGEYVINLVHKTIADGMNLTSKSIPSDESEWDISGFCSLESLTVRPKRVAESMVQMECKLFSIVEHGAVEGSARYVIGEVMMIHQSSNGESFAPIARLGGGSYLNVHNGETFELSRPDR
ncbi:MAG: flavin reductase family protein, partial [Fimbriimonadaceae bacterium]|nr:flavin reductase family protein [Fimbriimonadaceae bacterium]